MRGGLCFYKRIHDILSFMMLRQSPHIVTHRIIVFYIMKKGYTWAGLCIAVAVLVGYGVAPFAVRADQGQGEGEGQSQAIASSTFVGGQTSSEQEQAHASSSGDGVSALLQNTGSSEGESSNSVLNGQAHVSIGAHGETQIASAKVQSVQGNAMTVSAFGISFNIDMSGASFVGQPLPLPPIPAATSSSVQSVSPSISVGDTVTLQGTIDSSTGVVRASQVRDLTTQAQSNTNILSRINQLLQMIQQLRAQMPGLSQ